MFFFFPEISPGPLFSKQNAGRSSRPNTHTHPNSPITHTPTHRTVAWETASFWGTVVRPLSCLPALEAAAPPWRPRSCRRCYILWEWPSPMRTDVVESSSVDQRPLTWLDLTRFGFVWKASSKWKASWILKESFLKQVGCGDASLMCPCFFLLEHLVWACRWKYICLETVLLVFWDVFVQRLKYSDMVIWLIMYINSINIHHFLSMILDSLDPMTSTPYFFPKISLHRSLHLVWFTRSWRRQEVKWWNFGEVHEASGYHLGVAIHISMLCGWMVHEMWVNFYWSYV